MRHRLCPWTVDVSYTLRGSKTPLTTQKIVPPNTGKKFKFNASTNAPVDTPPTETIWDVLVRAAQKSRFTTWRASIKTKSDSADPLCVSGR